MGGFETRSTFVPGFFEDRRGQGIGRPTGVGGGGLVLRGGW